MNALLSAAGAILFGFLIAGHLIVWVIGGDEFLIGIYRDWGWR